MYLYLNKLTSNVWKKNCPNFLYVKYKAGRNLESFSCSFLAIFPLLAMQQLSSFILYTGLFFKKCIHVSGFLQLGAIYPNIRYDPRSKYNQQKSECIEHQQSLGSRSVLRPQQGF